MTDWQDPDPLEQAPIQIDKLGIKAHPVVDHEGEPKTWRDVVKQFNRHLKTIVLAPVSVPAAVINGVNNFVRGFGAMFTRRVEDAHREADRSEVALQEEHLAQHPELPSAPNQWQVDSTTEKLEELFDEFRAKGLTIEIEDLGNGRTALHILPAPNIEIASHIIRSEILPKLEAEDKLRQDSILLMPITDLNLSKRSMAAMTYHRLSTIGDLVNLTSARLLAAPRFGEASLREVRQKLAQIGLSLRGDSQDD